MAIENKKENTVNDRNDDDYLYDDTILDELDITINNELYDTSSDYYLDLADLEEERQRTIESLGVIATKGGLTLFRGGRP